MKANIQFQNSQSGMVLLVTLIMVGIMSVIAVSAIRGSSMQEAMAGNLHDRNLAFQAAEAGLRVAEKSLINAKTMNFDQDSNGLFNDQNQLNKTSVRSWTPEQWDEDSISVAKADVSLSSSIYPQYVIEKISAVDLGSTSGESVEFGGLGHSATQTVVFRITSRGFGLTDRSEVIVQSTYQASL